MNKIKNYDIIHTHNEHSFAALVAAYYKKRTRLPLVLTCHGQLRFGDFLADLAEKIYSKNIAPFIFNTSDAICVNSIMDKNYLLDFNVEFANKIHILSNAIDPGFLNGLALKSNSKKYFKFFVNNHDIILYVGRLIKRKGLDQLIKAINIIINTYKKKDVLLLLVGEGEDKRYFKNLSSYYNLNRYIHFLGEVSDDDLVYIYKNSRLFVLPSISEVCPTVILESMYFGIPVVATNIPGIYDHFEKYALLVPEKNEFELAKAILRVLSNKNLYNSLSFKGMEITKQKYTWDYVANEYEKIYYNLLNR
jgi:glycosyltransferase involved in cell wall biosynthesis